MLPCVELHFLCEHEGGIHCVETQKSNFLVLEGETLQSIWPCVICAYYRKQVHKALLQGFYGAKFGKKVIFKGAAKMIPKVPTNLGEGCVQMEQVNLDMKFPNHEREVAKQWL